MKPRPSAGSMKFDPVLHLVKNGDCKACTHHTVPKAPESASVAEKEVTTVPRGTSSRSDVFVGAVVRIGERGRDRHSV